MRALIRSSRLAGSIFLLVVFAGPALAQARYDGIDPAERFSIRFGGFRQDRMDTTIRVDSTALNLGTIVQLEDTLDVDDQVSVFRVDGFYRFNPRHRLDWIWFETKREGTVTLLEDIEIGDIVFMAGESLKTEYRNSLIKLGWSYSFINVQKYEFFIGAGLNFRDLKFKATNTIGGGVDTEDADVLAPLPTLNIGGRYNFTGKSSLNYRYEVFGLSYGDFDGKLQEATLLFEHNTFGHFGFGGGINSFNFDLELEDSDWRGELETSYLGFLAFFKAYF